MSLRNSLGALCLVLMCAQSAYVGKEHFTWTPTRHVNTFRATIGRNGEMKCPSIRAAGVGSCNGRIHSDCWSPGVRDLDCVPDHGLCCFDGCANKCMENPKEEHRTGYGGRNKNPCEPTPCGPNTMCSVNHRGTAVCRCQPRYIPMPDTIEGCCLPEDYPTQPRKKVDPCLPSPCGPGTICMTNHLDHAICKCQPGLIPNPDVITGCKAECTVDPDCRHKGRNFICRRRKCMTRPDPCKPSPCGKGTTCTPNSQGNPICKCLPGLIPKPDTITGCGPECLGDSECRYGLVCRSQRCVEKPDPCRPSPCGPGTTCKPNHLGNPICKCKTGLIPKPDTITGCGPECTIDLDCRGNLVCRNSACVEKPDPCNPSPCGPGTTCTPNRLGNPICKCKHGLVPKPDTITGCGPECVQDSECRNGLICQNHRCVERPDPCNPSPCGPGTTCNPSRHGNPICKCRPGLVPKPDTITGCGPECTGDPDCNSGYVCRQHRCVEKPDPCNPSPCGPGTTCRANSFGNPICNCRPGLVPKPDTITGCGPECTGDPDCKSGYICRQQRCVEKPDPCNPSPCGAGTTCQANSFGNPICNCLPGLVPKPDTITGCGPECTQDPDCKYGFVCQNQHCVEKPDPCNPSPCGPGTTCTPNRSGNPICKCRPGLVPKPDTITGCGPECVQNSDCKSGYICENQKCIEIPDPCNPTPCGPGTTCTPNRLGNPICKCKPGLVPKPDTITGCGPECQYDPDCKDGYICSNQRCIVRPDPCDPSPCGPNTACMVNRGGNPVCTCRVGFIPQPDTITGCVPKPEVRTEPPNPCDPSPCGQNTHCERNSYGNPICKCLAGFVPMVDTISGCVRERDPCEDNPCGANAECVNRGGRAVCVCPASYVGNPEVLCRKAECEDDSQCAGHLACFSYKCIDPCPGTCGSQANCEVKEHRPICRCPKGYTGNPLHECTRTVVIGQRYNERQQPEARNPFAVGQSYNKKEPTATRTTHVIGAKYSPPESPEPSNPTVVGAHYGSGCNRGCSGSSGDENSGVIAVRTRGDQGPTFHVIGSSYKRRKRQLKRKYFK